MKSKTSSDSKIFAIFILIYFLAFFCSAIIMNKTETKEIKLKQEIQIEDVEFFITIEGKLYSIMPVLVEEERFIEGVE